MRHLVLMAMLHAAGAAQAGPWDGLYRLAADADCAQIGVEGGVLWIGQGVFHGVGMTCEMTRPVNVLGMDATLYTMECAGQDEVWTERAMIMHDAERDGIIMIWNGFAFRYDRCPEV